MTLCLSVPAYYAEVAGLDYSICPTGSGFREMVIKDYENAKFQQPHQQAKHYCSLILIDQYWPSTEQVEGSHPVCRPIFPSQHLTDRVVKLDKGRSYCYFANGLNPKDDNSALVHYIQRNVHALIDLKLEKHKNLYEESMFYWCEILYGTFKFDRYESEVAALRQLTQEEFIDFLGEYIKIGAPRRKTLSIRVYSASHSSEYEADESAVDQTQTIQIDDIFSFRRSQPLYGYHLKEDLAT
ncbi:hypothetical protein Dimus_002001 [Dionaea muscipula]